MFRKILIANRGEVALRVIRACRELGISTVAVYSEADVDSLHVRLADEGVCIGKASSADSYLNTQRIISAAEIANAEAIHPGYGFLAENAEFAEICESCGIRFIGPPADIIRKMGNKALARKMMAGAGVPTIPGHDESVPSVAEAHEIAGTIGYPLMIKAVAGGGGRGMRIARNPEELRRGFRMAQAEARVAFGNGEVYLERYLERPRHIEIQILADSEGNVIHLGERDCSIQRRHQKLIEESPSPAVSEEMRSRIGMTAVEGASAIGYESAGTVEFLLDGGDFYFMEMNTRVQVEHPVTEEVTGIDIVKEQIRIADGQSLSVSQDDIVLVGSAIECRINAEDAEQGFSPCPGRITGFHSPGGPGVRVDTHVYQGYRIPQYYDSMIAKVITRGQDRAEAIARMERALSEFIIEGVKTTLPFHLKVMRDEGFRRGDFDTAYVEAINEAKRDGGRKRAAGSARWSVGD
jgi:acetyl-CoA carboxylase biotin carboxylase subunit